mmetsp:Transcript_4466/g.5937  ORF Transcript_4466/g.5937 Transcript_4466/m.5937 type:complete len:91 (-) Transcript_4466:27-299(-)
MGVKIQPQNGMRRGGDENGSSSPPSVSFKEGENNMKRSRRVKKTSFQKWFDIIFIESKAFKTFLTNFVLTYNLRAGVAFLVRIFSVLRRE